MYDVALQRRLAAQQTYKQQQPTPGSNPFAQGPKVGGVEAPKFGGGPTQAQGGSNSLLGGVSSAFSADGSAGRVVPGGFNGGLQGANFQMFG